MTERILELLKNQLSKMEQNYSYIVGAVGGALAVPQWITSQTFLIQHGVLMAVLIGVLFVDYLAGSRLAKISTAKKKNSKELFECIMRDFIIVTICIIAYAFDYLLGTGAVIYTACTVAFVYQNLYSFVANLAVLGWEEKFPLWLFKWLQDEIEVKKQKYFPDQGGKQK